MLNSAPQSTIGTPGPATIEALLSNLRIVREGISEQRYRQERALSRLGFRAAASPQPAGSSTSTNESPASDAISVLAREIDALNYLLNDLGAYSDALERQYSEKAGL